MRRLFWLLALIGMFTLAACGGSDGDDEETGDSTTDTTETMTEDESTTSTGDAGFTANITGAVEDTVTGSGYFQCDDVNGGELTLGAGFSMTDNVLILFPEGTAPGTYDLTESTGMAGEFSATYVGEDIMTAMYEDNVSGTLTLDEIAEASGEPVSGSFEFEASNEDAGSTVNVTGTFDFTAGENAYFNCTQDS